MSRAGSLRVAWQVLQAEGARAVRDRTLDRLAEARRQRSFSPAPATWRPGAPIPVLNLISTRPAPRLGGVQAQLLARIEREAESRPIALLYPDGAAWRLEVQEGETRRAILLAEPSFEAVVRQAADVVGAGAVHVEGLAGLPLESLLRLGRRLILSLHDFAAFCLRPHLLEQPVLQFCCYSRDLARCGRCLREDWPVEDAFQAERRAVAAELLQSAEALVFPSGFLQRAYSDLFPGLPPERQHILAPGVSPLAAAPQSHRPLRHVALVGGVQAHKGALVFAEAVRRMKGVGLRWSAYGGGDPALLHHLRGLGVRVRGYYRSGSLPGLLRRDRVDLALLLSIVPESYGLALGECLAAGVPVVAFDLGALGERIPRLGAGRLVPPEAGAEGVAAALDQLLTAGGLPEVETAESIPNARSAAVACLQLYRELGLR